MSIEDAVKHRKDSVSLHITDNKAVLLAHRTNSFMKTGGQNQ